MQSIAFVRTAAGEQKTEDRPDADADGDGLIGIFAHVLVHHFCAGDRLVADTAADFLGAFQRGGETLAGFADFFTGHMHTLGCVRQPGGWQRLKGGCLAR